MSSFGAHAATLIRFGLVGGLASTAHMSIALALLLSWNWPPLSANLAAFAIAFAISFPLHFFWTFSGRSRLRSSLIRFFAISFSAFAFNQFCLALLVETTPLPHWISMALAVVVVPITSFVLSHFWGFAQQKTDLYPPEKTCCFKN